MKRRLLPILLALLVAATVADVAAQHADLEAERARRLLVRGMTHLQTGDAEAALESLEMALQLAPDRAGILSAMAAAHVELGDFPAATFYAERAARLVPSSADLLLQLAEIQAWSGDAAAAMESYSRLSRHHPNHVEGLAAAARHAMISGETERASQLLAEMIRVHGPNSLLLDIAKDMGPESSLVVERALIDRINAAEAPVEDLVSVAGWIEAPAVQSVFPNLLARFRSTYPELAPRGAGPPPPDLYADAGTAPETDRAPSADLDALEDAIEADPRDVGNWATAAAAYVEAGHPKRAWQIIEEALILFPANAELTVTGALALLEMEDLERAQTLTAPITETIPRAALAMAYVMAESGALADARRLLSAAPGDSFSPEWLAYRAMVHELLGDADAARRDAEHAASLAPDHAIVLEALGRVRFMLDDVAQAVSLLESAAGRGSPRPRVLERLADALESAGRPAEADAARARIHEVP